MVSINKKANDILTEAFMLRKQGDSDSKWKFYCYYDKQYQEELISWNLLELIGKALWD